MRFCVKTFIFLFAVVSTVAKIGTCFSQSIDHWETIIYSNDTWKYKLGTSEPDANWRNLTFDDSSWLEGEGGIGYGDWDDNTVISSGTWSVYLRINFNIIDTGKIVQAILNVDYDDAFVAYINNVEVARANIGTTGDHPAYNYMPDDDHEAQMYQGGDPEYFTIDKQTLKSCLKQGDNVLAVQVHNYLNTSSDLSSIIFLSLGITDISNNYGEVPDWFQMPVTFEYSKLPLVFINTGGQSIPDDPKITATMGIIDNGEGNLNYISDTLNGFNGYDGYIGIEMRGESSQSFPKKCYGMETRDFMGENNTVSLLGLPEENDWILNGPYTDKTLMRNFLAYNLSNNIGRYASRTKYCELYINNSYEGVYILMENIKRDKNRVDIAKLDADDLAGDSLTGGYIIKLDKPYWSGYDWESAYGPQRFYIVYPESDEIMTQQRSYIHNYVDDFETALNGANFADPLVGYPKYIDVGSFIDHFILNEISKNADGFRWSAYMYKDKDSKNGKLNAGPVWDFDIAFGNINYWGNQLYTGWQIDCPGDDGQVPFWWGRLLDDPAYTSQLKCRWEELRQGPLNTDTILNFIDSMADYLNDAQKRNFETWNILGEYVWPNYYIGQTYQDEVNYFKNWITQRLTWIDDNIPGTCNVGIEEKNNIAGVSVNPNPFNRSVTFSYNINEPGTVCIKIYDITGREVITLVNEKQDSGNHIFTWDSGNQLQNGMYIYSFLLNNEFLYKNKLIKY